MTATVTSTKKEADRRIAPGDGQKMPVNHIVRIVVVPRSGSNAGQSDALGHNDGLTKEELRAAEAVLKEKDAPPSSGGTSTGQESSAKMFDVLEPTDIVVVGREPASIRTVDSSGKPASANPATEAGQTASAPKLTKRLVAHDHHDRGTVLRVWTDSDTIEYQCEKKFEIKTVERAGWNIYDAPPNPFAGQPPYKATQRATDGLWVWRSSKVPATANNQQFKMTFTIFDERGENGEDVDPDIVCGDPPPS